MAGDDPFGDFPLDEQNAFGQGGADAENLFNDGRGDVVREVAGENGGAEGGEIDLKTVAGVNVETGMARELTGEGLDHERIDFQGVNSGAGGKEAFGECALAGPNLDNGGGRGAADRLADAIEKERVLQKMLAVFLAQVGLPLHFQLAMANGHLHLGLRGHAEEVRGLEAHEEEVVFQAAAEVAVLEEGAFRIWHRIGDDAPLTI